MWLDVCHFVESKMSKNYISAHIFLIAMLLLFNLCRTGIISVTKMGVKMG